MTATADTESDPTGDDPARASRRALGLQRMSDIYGFDMNDGPGDFFGMTVEHLFGEVWSRDGLSDRDRRLLVLGVLAADGLDDVVSLQADTTLAKSELSADELREIVIFLTHYVGWPTGAKLNAVVESAIARNQRRT